MCGDVFGNGMLLSRHIRLLAAFDHRHIFLDPTPDAAASFAERERMFALPRSSWADYDSTLISAGGGVWPRGAKSIRCRRRCARRWASLPNCSMTPAELMHAILLAPVDLFYNGGIGTYVKATSESHAECGDRANDAIRVNGAELRCKVVVEGGNLGCTQLGRIEFALRGGLINTDAIDNSAGVDCSDHEVNIKIALNAVVADGELTVKQRDKLLAEMTDDVAALVLRDNTFQNQVLAVTRSRGAALLDEQGRYMRHLAARGRLNRALEFLPDDHALAARQQAGIGLTTPELAVLLAYHKMELYDLVLASDVPEDTYIATTLQRYFPAAAAHAVSGGTIEHHPLKREIIATHVVNSLVNRVGPTFVHHLHEETGAQRARHRARLRGHAPGFRPGIAVAGQRSPGQRGGRGDAEHDRAGHRAAARARHRVAAAAARCTARPRRDHRALRTGRRGRRRRPRTLARAGRTRRTRSRDDPSRGARRAAGAGATRGAAGRAGGRPGHRRGGRRDRRRRRDRGRRLFRRRRPARTWAGCRRKWPRCPRTRIGRRWRGWRCARICRRWRAT